MTDKICVVGSGGWGTALAAHLKKLGNEVTLWSWLEDESKSIEKHKENREFLPGIILPEGIKYSYDLNKAVEDAEFLVFAVPSHAVLNTARQVSSHIRQGVIIVNVSKGFEHENHQTLGEVIAKQCPKNTVVILSGPSHAEEVARGMPTTVVAASHDRLAAEQVQNLFMSPEFRVYTSDDVTGVELGGALKNVIALCAGICDGLGLGDNTKAALMTRGISEISRLGIKMGALPATFAGLSGVGDLIVTCTSMHSRNRRAGVLIGQGKSAKEALEEVRMVVEGVRAARTAFELSKKHKIDMPIIRAAYEILFENKSPSEAVQGLMERDKKHEHENTPEWGAGLL